MKPISQSIQLKMNGITIQPTPKSIMANALELMVDDFKYRSKENLVEILIGVRDLVIDWLEAQGRSIKKYKKEQVDLRRRAGYMSREQMVKAAYNDVLHYEDLGPLRGFGLSNKFKDKLRGNPELNPIMEFSKTQKIQETQQGEITMEAKDVTKKGLMKVAKEFNEQMGLEPPILVDLKVDALRDKCIEAAAQIDLEQDEFSDEVWEILGALGCDPRVEASDGAVVATDSQAKETVEEEISKEQVEVALEDTLVEDFKAAKKLAELKELAQEWECFANLDLDSYAGLQGPKQLRADMLECLPDEIREQVDPNAQKTTTKTTKSESEKAPEKTKTKEKTGVPAREGSMSQYIDSLMEEGISLEELIKQGIAEAESRNIKSMKTPGSIKAHIRYRASKGFKPAEAYNK